MLISSCLKIIRFFKALMVMVTTRKLPFLILLLFCFFITLKNQKTDAKHESVSFYSFPASIAFPPESSYGVSSGNPRSPEKASAASTLASIEFDFDRKLYLDSGMTTSANLHRIAPALLRRVFNSCFIDQAGVPFYPQITDWHDSNFSVAETATYEFPSPRLRNLPTIGGYGSTGFEEWERQPLLGARVGPFGGMVFNCNFHDLQEIEEPELYVGVEAVSRIISQSPSSSSMAPSSSPSPSPSSSSIDSNPSHLDSTFSLPPNSITKMDNEGIRERSEEVYNPTVTFNIMKCFFDFVFRLA